MCVCRCMQALCGGDRLAMLLERAFLTRDELLFKVLRNLSQQADVVIKAGFLLYMDQLAGLLQVPHSTPLLYPLLTSSFTRFAQPLTTCSLGHSLALLNHSPLARFAHLVHSPHSLTHLLTHSRTHSLTHSLTHQLTHPMTPCSCYSV